MDFCFYLTIYIQIMVLNSYFSTTILCFCLSYLKQFYVNFYKFHNVWFLDVIFNNKISVCKLEFAVIVILTSVDWIL